MINELAMNITLNLSTYHEKAVAIQDFVRREIQHDYKSQRASVDPELTLVHRTEGNRCGHRAAVFQALAMAAGLKARVVLYRGHVANEVIINGKWISFDATRPQHQQHADLIAIIKQGPVCGYAYIPDYTKAYIFAPPLVFGQYSQWLKLLADKTNVVLPRDILHGAGKLSESKPNVIIRHDLDHSPDNLLPMLHEENQLGLRSVTYVRVDNEEYSLRDCAPMLKMFEDEGFEVGLHITVIKGGFRQDLAFECFYEQLVLARHHFKVDTVQAHADDRYGVGTGLTNYDLENEHPFGFRNILDSTGRFTWRIADSLGVMYPGDPARYIREMKKGRLYYCLWHPEYYEFTPPWVHFTGFVAEKYSDKHLRESLVTLNHQMHDTDYFNHMNHPHLQASADYLRSHISTGRFAARLADSLGVTPQDEILLDLACGWGTLNILIRNKRKWLRRAPRYQYVGIESSYSRMKASQMLHMMLKQPFPRIICDDIQSPKRKDVKGDWVVLLGWEGDIRDITVLDKLVEYMTPNGRLLISYIDEHEYGAWKRSKRASAEYCTLSRNALAQFLQRNRLKLREEIRDVYPNNFPRHLIVCNRLQFGETL